MAGIQNKEFVARAIYHHAKRTKEHVTLLVYQDANEAYELLDDREAEHEYLAGTRDFILEEWGTRNRDLVRDGFQLDNLAGGHEWQQFIR